MAIAANQLFWALFFIGCGIAQFHPALLKIPLLDAVMPYLVALAYFTPLVLIRIGFRLDRRAAYAALRLFLLLLFISIVLPA